jgi:dTDP-4-amino-4,6-dideoxygalactose transaminase
VDVAPWEEFQERTGLPVLIDAAAGFACQQVQRIPVMISLHATKVLGAGEGAIVLARDPSLIIDVKRRLNFGVYGVRSVSVPGFNGKLSEYAAAVGLAALDVWPATRTGWLQLLTRYDKGFDSLGVQRAGPSNGGISSTLVCRLPVDARDAALRFAEAGVGTLRWYGDGCHAEKAFESFSRGPMPVTSALASSCLGLPFFLDLDDDSLHHVMATLCRVLNLE